MILSIEKGSCLPSRLTMLKLVPFIAVSFLFVACRLPGAKPATEKRKSALRKNWGGGGGASAREQTAPVRVGVSLP